MQVALRPRPAWGQTGRVRAPIRGSNIPASWMPPYPAAGPPAAPRIVSTASLAARSSSPTSLLMLTRCIPRWAHSAVSATSLVWIAGWRPTRSQVCRTRSMAAPRMGSRIRPATTSAMLRSAGPTRAAQLRDGLDPEGPMLGVDDYPVEAGVGEEPHHRRLAELHQHGADRDATGGEGAFETILGDDGHAGKRGMGNGARILVWRIDN